MPVWIRNPVLVVVFPIKFTMTRDFLTVSPPVFRALRRNSGKPSNIDDSVRWRFWVHSAVDTQRMDGDSGVAGVPGVSARTGRRGEDAETVGAAQACSQGV